jgi:hypothetical protein
MFSPYSPRSTPPRFPRVFRSRNSHMFAGPLRPRAGIIQYKQVMLLGLTAFAVMLWCWHIFHGQRRHIFLPTGVERSRHQNGIKGRYWSVSEKGALEGLATFTKPEVIDKIVAIIFYGRPATVSILDCYLKVTFVYLGFWRPSKY